MSNVVIPANPTCPAGGGWTSGASVDGATVSTAVGRLGSGRRPDGARISRSRLLAQRTAFSERPVDPPETSTPV